MRVLITGLPLFSKRLADDLQAFDPENEYLFYDTYSSKKALLAFILKLPKADLVISMNGVTDKSRTLDLVLKFKKKLVLQWMGSDAMYALDRNAKGTLLRKYIDYATNFVDAPWILDEVTALGVKAETLHFKFIEDVALPVDQYDKIQVVTYVSQNRQVFYGMDWVSHLAELNPSIDFLVYGASNPQYETENLKMFGWQAHNVFKENVRKGAVFLRLTEHDGFPVSVMEAMAYGAECITRLPIEHAHYVNDINQLQPSFELTCARIKERGLKPNTTLATAIRQTFQKEVILQQYVDQLKKLIQH
jgi:glycosyltransferase involved in cell wall biosynthesis